MRALLLWLLILNIQAQFDFDPNIESSYADCPLDGPREYKSLRHMGTRLMQERKYWQSQACYRAALDVWFNSFKFQDLKGIKEYERKQAQQTIDAFSEGMETLAEGPQNIDDGATGGVIPHTELRREDVNLRREINLFDDK